MKNYRTALLCATIALLSAFTTSAADHPNIIFILADDMGYGDLGCYGADKIKTPNIDRLAKEGILFTDGHCGASTCTPTRYGLMTGRHPWRSWCKYSALSTNAPLLIEEDRVTIASLLKSAGYSTSIVGKWHLGYGHEEGFDKNRGNLAPNSWDTRGSGPNWNGELKPGPLENGFDYAYVIPVANSFPPYVFVENYRVAGLRKDSPIGKLESRNHGKMEGGEGARWTDEELIDKFADKLVSQLESLAEKQKPFFLYYTPTQPHIGSRSVKRHAHWPCARFKGTSEAGPYGDVVQELDWSVGEILKTLDRLGLTDNTLVIFTSDNGGYTRNFNGHQPCGPILRGGKGDLVEGGIRVPFVAKWPGRIKPSTRSKEIFSTTDMLATFAAIIGKDLPAGVGPDSYNVLPGLLGQMLPHPERPVVLSSGGTGAISIRAGKWKLIDGQGNCGYGEFRAKRPVPTPKPGDPPAQLYNLDEDLGEANNLYRKHPEIVHRLKVSLEKIKADENYNPTELEQPKEKLSIEQLKTLFAKPKAATAKSKATPTNIGGKIASETTTSEAWPPRHLQDLPADYQDRQRRALETQLQSISRLRPGANPVLWVRFGIAGLALERHVDQINAYIEDDGFEYKPSDKFGFSLFSLPYVRLYALFNDRTGTMKGRLSPKAQANLEKTLWACAKANSKLAEAQRGVWDMDGSENHHMASKVSDFLVAQFLKDVSAYADLKYDDGSTAQQQYEARLAYWHRWIDSRVRRGLFMEDGGSSYQNYTIEALLNLRDFVEDDVLRKKADMFLDFVFANIAEETLGVQRGGPKTRTKEEGFRSRAYDLLFDSPGDTFELSNYQFSTSDNYPAPAIVELAKDFRNRGVYSFAKLAPGAVAAGTSENKTTPTLVPGSKWRTMDKDNLMVRNGFATAHYIMASHGLDTAAKADPYRAQRWQGIVFANDPMARIGMDGKSGAKGGYLSNPFKTIQDRNVMVTMKWGPVIDQKTDPRLWIYFSSALDAVEEKGGWIFVKSGEAYAAIRIVEGGYKWSRPWKHRTTFSIKEKSYVTPNSGNTPIITVVNDAADYGDNFAAFKRALVAQPIGWKDGVLEFATITHEGPLKPGSVSGETVNLRPSQVNDSPFIRADWGSGIVFIREGKKTLKLDFSDPNDPLRTVGAPVTSEFPPGVGTSTPIVFDKRMLGERLK